MGGLSELQCQTIAKGTPPLNASQRQTYLEQMSLWTLSESQDAIQREFRFTNFHETMAFVNAVAWIAHQQDHHPELSVSYNCCRVNYTTHSCSGLSLNDFICAARIDALLA